MLAGPLDGVGGGPIVAADEGFNFWFKFGEDFGGIASLDSAFDDHFALGVPAADGAGLEFQGDIGGLAEGDDTALGAEDGEVVESIEVFAEVFARAEDDGDGVLAFPVSGGGETLVLEGEGAG